LYSVYKARQYIRKLFSRRKKMPEDKKTPEQIQEELISDLENQGDSNKKESSSEDEKKESSEEDKKESSEDEKKESSEDEEEDDESDKELLDPQEVLKEEIAALKKELTDVKTALELRLQEDIAALSKEDQALIEELAEGDALEKARVITKLLKAGKIQKSYNATQDARAGQKNIQAPPKTPEEAAQQVLKALEARSL
jgi:hypothetical protein